VIGLSFYPYVLDLDLYLDPAHKQYELDAARGWDATMMLALKDRAL
jgi:hypothetical protein